MACVVFSCASNTSLAGTQGAQQPATPAKWVDPLSFEIKKYVFRGATLVTTAELNKLANLYVGKNRTFADVNKMQAAAESLYRKKGYAVVEIDLPEQVLNSGIVIFNVIEGRIRKVQITNSKEGYLYSDKNVLNALPSVRELVYPQNALLSKEINFANQSSTRQIGLVLSPTESPNLIDANINVTGINPNLFGITYDNTGSTESGYTRLGLSYKNTNVFDRDHVFTMQTQVSPEHYDASKVRVFSTSYKIPFYVSSDSLDFTAAYSNVQSTIGGTTNFNGGGTLYGVHYNQSVYIFGSFSNNLTYGLDYKDFKPVQQTTAPVTVMYNEIVSTPLSLTFTTQGKLGLADTGFSLGYSKNIPVVGKGHNSDFQNYDQINSVATTYKYEISRLSANLAIPMGNWLIRTVFAGQNSRNYLTMGEQFRLGGMDGVRGFSEASEGGDRGYRSDVELYAPPVILGKSSTRGLVFYDEGQVTTNLTDSTIGISSYGVGLRAYFSTAFSGRVDVGKIINGGSDPIQQKGATRMHAAMSLTF